MRDTPSDGRSPRGVSERTLPRRGLLRASGALVAGTALSGRAVGAEADGDGGPRVAWNRTYGDEFWQRGWSVVQTPDGGFVVAGETAAPADDPAGALVVRTDADGVVEWTRIYSDEYYQGAVSVLAAPEGGYVLVLEATTVDHYRNVAAMGLDEDGTVRWRREYEVGDADVRGAVRRSGGGYAVAGTAYSDPAEAFLLLLDAQGRMERFETYGTDDGGASLFGRTAVEADEGFALLTIAVSGNDFSPLLVRTNADGTERWRRRYDVRGDDRGEDLVRGADGGFVIAGSARGVVCEEITPGQPEQISTSPDAFLLKVNADGCRQWAQTFSAPGPEYASADASAVVRVPDGGYAFAGSRDDPDGGGTPFWVVGTDADGERLWERTAGGRQYNSPFSMINTADGGYAVVGLTDAGHPAEPDVRLVRLTADA